MCAINIEIGSFYQPDFLYIGRFVEFDGIVKRNLWIWLIAKSVCL